MFKPKVLLLTGVLVLGACQGDTPEPLEGYAEVNETRLYYELTGRGEPLVLVHGWSFDTRCWDDQFPAFSQHFKVLRYDLRGFGRSDVPQVGAAYSHTNDLVALLDHLDLERVHLLGHSFGGRIAIDFALRYPERMLSLLLPDAAVDLSDPPALEELSAWIGGTWRAGREKGVAAARQIWLQGSPFAPAMDNAHASAKVRQMVEDYSGWHWQNDNPSVGIDSYPRERLADIGLPTLIVLGLLNPQYYHEVAAIQHQYIPNSTFVTMPGVGHALNIEDPAEFNRIVLEFLGAVTLQ